jgi:hypothetical protein
MGAVSASVGLGASLLCAGVLIYLVYCVMDRKEDKSAALIATEPEEGFKFSDLRLLFGNRGFWYITLLCLMFYGGVFPFLKFATKLMVMKYGVEENLAGYIPSMLPYGTIILTPLFGYIYDKVGKGATLMLLGSILLTAVHVIFALPFTSVALAIVVMVVLGIAFGLVPSAMWPSVPKIIPMQLLGTAYALIFYIQNIGLSMVPILIGKVNQANTDANGIIDYTASMAIFACFGVTAIIISVLLKAEDKRNCIVVTPWDLDTSLGGNYNGTYYGGNYSNWPIASIVNSASPPFSTCLREKEFKNMLRERWLDLREYELSIDSVARRLYSYCELFYETGAWQRQQEWIAKIKYKPMHCTDLRSEVNQVVGWYQNRVAEIDNYFGIEPTGVNDAVNTTETNTRQYTIYGNPASPGYRGIVVQKGRRYL